MRTSTISIFAASALLYLLITLLNERRSDAYVATAVPPPLEMANSVRNYACTDGVSVKGDGIHDDTSGIQNAIDAVSKAGGGALSIPTGTYSITRTLYLRRWVRLVGCGEGSVIMPTLRWPKAVTTPAVIAFDGVEGAGITGIKFDFRGPLRLNAGAIDSPAVLIENGSTECVVQEVTFLDAGLRPSQSRPTGPVVEVNSSSRNRIRDCRFVQSGAPDTGAQCAFAIRVLTDFKEDLPKRWSESNIIDGCYFKGPFNWNVVELAGPGVRYNQVRSNQFIGCSSLTFVDVDKGANYNFILNNLVDAGEKTPLYLNDVNTRFAAFADHGNDQYADKAGVRIPAHSNKGNEFCGNIARRCKSGSSDVAECLLFLQRTSLGNYSQNLFEDLNESKRGCGIWIDNSVSGVNISGNQILGVKQGIIVGMIATGEIGHLDISHNHVESEGTALIVVGKNLAPGWGTGCRVVGNDLANRTAEGHALAVYDQCQNVIVSSNSLSGGFEGLYCGSPGAIITANVIRGAKERNIRIGNGGGPAVLSNNQSVQPGIADLIIHEGATPPVKNADW